MNTAAPYEGIVVLGMPRSGTTLIRRLLNAHPSIVCPPETNLLNAAARMIREARFGDGLAVGMVSGLSFSGYSEPQVAERLREFVFGFLREIRAKANKPRWAEKTAFDSFYVDEIETICGNACRYICLFRHGLDQVCSIDELCRKMGTYPPELHAYVRRFAAPHEAFAHAWADVDRRLLRFAEDHPDWCLKLRYEDIVNDAPGALNRLFRFLDEPADVEQLLGSLAAPAEAVGLGDWKTYTRSAVDAASVGRWKETLSADAVGRLAVILNPVLEAIGYDPIAVAKASDTAKARHRYALGLMAARMKGARPPAGES